MVGEKTREELMHKIMAYAAAAHELVLFLDTHPNDRAALNLYRELIEKLRELKGEYTIRFGPITVDDAGAGGTWDWMEQPFPWEQSAAGEEE